MNLGRILPVAIGVALLGLLAWGVTSLLERLTERDPAVVVTAAPPPPSETAHIAATLFYAAAEGDALLPVQREVPLAEGLVAQGRQILAAQFAPPPAPYISAIPPGTMLRAFYLTEKGDAFVDVSGISAGHPGGSLTELLTVHAIVNAVTANLPAVQRVQILVDGKEVDTIAGHVDIRQPLLRDTSLVRAQEANAP
ncbi:MAG TPA: GerMN domain-containing protein [Vicinamibacterales bacterium]|nr:GerMN domain-containing protein [Vicinamibacterales bacterium]